MDANLLAFNSQTLTSSTNSTGFNVGEGAELRVQLEVTGTVSGTSPTLDAKLQDSADGSAWADTGVAFTQVTATGSRQQRELANHAGPPVRARGDDGGRHVAQLRRRLGAPGPLERPPDDGRRH